jgi:exopolysaccharide production protein ExoZ
MDAAFEVTFYVALFAVSIAGWTRSLERGALAWLVLLLACSVVFPGWNHEATPPAYRLPLLPACTGFAAGLLIPAALRLGWISRWTFPAALLLALASLWLSLGDSRFVSGILAALMVAGIVRAEARMARPALEALKKLGDWSYALYLCHVPIILVALRLAPLQMNPVLLWFCTLASCLAASALMGTLDVRLYRASKQMVDGANSRALHRLVAGYLALFAAIAVYGAVDTALKERRSRQERAILSRIPADALRRRETAQGALETAGFLARSYLRGEVTEVTRLADGALIVRGWLIDEAASRRRPSAAVFYNGAELKVTQPSRKRPAIAASLGRPDLAKAGIGFGIAHRIACVPGAEVVVVGLDLAAGDAAVLPGKAMIEECP